jgi:hypothetical protein
MARSLRISVPTLLAIAAVHVAIVTTLAAAAAPRGTDDASVAWLTPLGTQNPPDSGIAHRPSPSTKAAFCATFYEIDLQGRLYEPGPPSAAFLATLPPGSDGVFPEIGFLCPGPLRPADPPPVVWSKLRPGEEIDNGLGVY